jgi:hypothetical protein
MLGSWQKAGNCLCEGKLPRHKLRTIIVLKDGFTWGASFLQLGYYSEQISFACIL